MKDKFAELDEEFKDTVANMGEDEINSTIAKNALNNEALIEARDADQDLAEKKQAASDAGAAYREGLKMNKLRIAFCRRVLGDKSKDNGFFEKT